MGTLADGSETVKYPIDNVNCFQEYFTSSGGYAKCRKALLCNDSHVVRRVSPFLLDHPYDQYVHQVVPCGKDSSGRH